MARGQGAVQSTAHGYRRGLVLGLTMAEIVLLLLFSLLLALAAMFLQEHDKFEEAVTESELLREQLDNQEQRINQLMAELERDDLGQMKKELVALKDIERKIEYILQRFQGEGSVADKVSQLVERLSKADKVADALSAAGLPLTPEELAKELARLEGAQQALAEADEKVRDLTNQLNDTKEAFRDLEKSSKDAKELLAKHKKLTEELEKARKDLKTAEAEASRAEKSLQQREGQLANMRNTLERYGRGTEKPACWADEETGKTKYIYDIELSDEGLAVHLAETPPWASARDLPVRDVTFKRVLSPNKFMEETKPIYDWSEANECRFFVRAYDLTGATKKQLYKRHMRFLEGRFYKYEVLEPRQKND